MKNLIIVFLSLTCLAAQAQYNQSRTKSKPSLLSYYSSPKSGKQASPFLRIPAEPAQTITTQNTTYSAFISNAIGTSSQQGYWSGSQMTTTGMNGRFQSIQSFDMNGNLRETKATYQISTRKKR